MTTKSTSDTNRKILIVDDNRNLCENIKDILDSHGFSVTCAFDGLQAVKKAAKAAPSIVLMDVDMPVMDGLSALRRMKQLVPSARVLMMSGNLTDSLIEVAAFAGAVGTLLKPLDVAQLLTIINSHLVK